jgi:DNA repair protein RadC
VLVKWQNLTEMEQINYTQFKKFSVVSEPVGYKPTEHDLTTIRCSKDSADFIRQFYFGDIDVYESFFVILLNNANQVFGYSKISQGGIVGTVVDVKLISKYIVDTLASGIIIAHNHPSGTLRPSDADMKITNSIKTAARVFDCKLLDHIILTSDGYYSFTDEGIL